MTSLQSGYQPGPAAEAPSLYGPTGKYRFAQVSVYDDRQVLMIELRNGAPGKYRWESATEIDSKRLLADLSRQVVMIGQLDDLSKSLQFRYRMSGWAISFLVTGLVLFSIFLRR